ncbi:response regulator transcription factor [Agrobacterium rhizogenes]|nr:response regulator transcription factor [Rhizobium rhizogenes]NTJ77766.1 response regulator transcription factor [Rhizobium rhizogenes]
MDFRVLIHLNDAQKFLLLRHILAIEGFRASSVVSFEEMASELSDGLVMAVIVDGSISEVSPSNLLALKRIRPKALITVLCDQHDHRFDATGADFVLSRPFDPAHLIGLFRRFRVDALIELGGVECDANFLRFADIEMNTVAARVRRSGKEVALTALQFRLLRYLLQDPETVRSRAELIAAAWPAVADVEPRTVDIHMGHIRRALRKFGPDLIRTVRTQGYALGLNPDRRQ